MPRDVRTVRACDDAQHLPRDRDDHDAVGGELVDERRGQLGGFGRDEDAVEGGQPRESERAGPCVVDADAGVRVLGVLDPSPFAAGLPPQHLITRTTQVVAIVLTSLGALICFAGYGFLPWGPDASYSEVGEAVREHGLDGRPVTEAYFAWLGWVILLGLVATVVLVSLGRRPSVNASVVRPLVATGTVVAGLVHAWVVLDSEALDIAQVAVGLGLLLSALSAILPLRTSVRMTAVPPRLLG